MHYLLAILKHKFVVSWELWKVDIVFKVEPIFTYNFIFTKLSIDFKRQQNCLSLKIIKKNNCFYLKSIATFSNDTYDKKYQMIGLNVFFVSKF